MKRLFASCSLSLLAALAGAEPPDDAVERSAAESGSQSHASIEEAAEALVRREHIGNASRVLADADALDERLRLPRCTAPLSTDAPFGDGARQRITVEVGCNGEETWRIFVPVRLETFGAVVVAARAIPRGTLLSRSDLLVEERGLGRLARGHYSELEDVVGQRARRSLSGGAAITPNVLETPPLIRRGQTVTVKAGGAGMAVSMTGKALTDGARGQVIDVENASSKRRVQAVVRSERVVEVLLY